MALCTCYKAKNSGFHPGPKKKKICTYHIINGGDIVVRARNLCSMNMFKFLDNKYLLLFLSKKVFIIFLAKKGINYFSLNYFYHLKNKILNIFSRLWC